MCKVGQNGWPKSAVDTVEDLQSALKSEVALRSELNELCLTLHGAIKETTQQMNNNGNGEHTIPSWFASDLYKYVDLIKGK